MNDALNRLRHRPFAVLQPQVPRLEPRVAVTQTDPSSVDAGTGNLPSGVPDRNTLFRTSLSKLDARLGFNKGAMDLGIAGRCPGTKPNEQNPKIIRSTNNPARFVRIERRPARLLLLNLRSEMRDRVIGEEERFAHPQRPRRSCNLMHVVRGGPARGRVAVALKIAVRT